MTPRAKQTNQYKIIEVEKPHSPLPELTQDVKESLKTLKYQPGYIYLMQRFNLQRAELERQLKFGFSLTEQQLHFLQAGIYHMGWIEEQIKTLTKEPRKAEFIPSPDEIELFERHSAALEAVG